MQYEEQIAQDMGGRAFPKAGVIKLSSLHWVYDKAQIFHLLDHIASIKSPLCRFIAVRVTELWRCSILQLLMPPKSFLLARLSWSLSYLEQRNCEI